MLHEVTSSVQLDVGACNRLQVLWLIEAWFNPPTMRFTTVVFPAGFQSLLLLRDCSALLIRNAGTGLRRNWRPLMLSVGSVITAPTTVDEKENYWDKHRPEVPGKFLESIRTEKWRGMFEPCSDHPLTEVHVEGAVPQELEGTLFRNGENLVKCMLCVVFVCSLCIWVCCVVRETKQIWTTPIIHQ